MKLKQTCWECAGKGILDRGWEREVCGDCSGTGCVEIDSTQLLEELGPAEDLEQLCARLDLAASERQSLAHEQRYRGDPHEADTLDVEAWVLLSVREVLERFLVRPDPEPPPTSARRIPVRAA